MMLVKNTLLWKVKATELWIIGKEYIATFLQKN